MPTSPHILPLVEPIGARYQSLTVDSRLINGIAEKGTEKGEMYVYRRPAFRQVRNVTAGTARGMYNWRSFVYTIVGGNVYKNATLIGTVANLGTYSFAPVLGAFPSLFIQNGTNAYTISSSDVVAPVTDPNYPSTTVGGAVYLNGTVYVMNPEGGVQGSDAAANDPSTWDPLNSIIAQLEPKPAIYLAKQLVYVLALKEGYTEAFYDAGNPVGSPLAPVQGAKMNYGCVDGKTVRDVGGDLLWLANSGEGFYCVVQVTGLKPDVISTPNIERLLSIAGTYYAWNVRIEGHRLYAITNFVTNVTLVYDLTSQIWYQWTDAAGNALPYIFSCQGDGTAVYFLHQSNGTTYALDMAINKDEGESPFACTIYTPNFDGGTRRDKILPVMDILGDQVNTTVTVAFSDNDYATWSQDYPVSMALDRPRIEGLGSFTKRAFRFTHQSDTPFRFRGAEMYIDAGTS